MMVLSATTRPVGGCAGPKQAPGVLKPAPARAGVSVAATSRLSMHPDEQSALCRVSYGTNSSSSTDRSLRPTMPSAARSAFKALERDSNAAIQRSRVASSATAAAAAASASDTLCLVTYSDDEDAAASWQQQQQQQGRVLQPLFTSSILLAAAAATLKAHPGKAGAIFAALCSEDDTEADATEVGDLPGVMETLCMLSYDEESA